jgi:hypothetical protein
VKGVIKDLKISFTKQYTRPIDGQKVAWKYEGSLDRQFDQMKGWWGPIGSNVQGFGTRANSLGLYGRWSHVINGGDGDNISVFSGSDGEEYDGGRFLLKRRAVDYFLYRPSDADFAKNKARALWKMAFNYVLRSVQARHMQWKIILDRRNRRRRYIELIARQEERGRLDAGDHAEWESLLRTIPPVDLRFWRSLAYFVMRRQVFH